MPVPLKFLPINLSLIIRLHINSNLGRFIVLSLPEYTLYAAKWWGICFFRDFWSGSERYA
jgi:hypothetical protein